MFVMIGMYEGKSTLGIPIIDVERYLNFPKHGRWVVYLVIALLIDLDLAFLDGEKRTILVDLLGGRETK